MEDDILRLLRQGSGQAFSVKQIGKIIDRQRFRQDANWARSVLQSMAARQLIDRDNDGRFFIGLDQEP